MKIQIKNNDELKLIIHAVFAFPNQGIEQLRMFDKTMNAIEQIAHVEYNADGHVLLSKVSKHNNNLLELDKSGNPIPLTFLNTEPSELDLSGCFSWMRERLKNFNWQAADSRKALHLLERFSITADAD